MKIPAPAKHTSLLSLFILTVGINCYAQNPLVYFTFDNSPTNLMPVDPQDNSLGGNYLFSQYTASTYKLANIQSLYVPADIVTNGPVGNYLNFQFPSTPSFGMSQVQTSINSLVPSLSSYSIEFLVKFSTQFCGQREGDLFSFGPMSAVFEISQGNSFPNFSFKGVGTLANLDLVADFNGIDRKSLSYYLDDDWHHLVFIVRPLPNGTLEQQIYVDGMSPQGFSNVNTGTIGGNYDFIFNFGSSKQFDFLGGLDELAIYDRYLTAGEIYEHYLNFKDHHHYKNAGTLATPASFNTQGILDPLEFPVGYDVNSNNNSLAAKSIVQIKAYPLPRFQPLHALHRNVNFVRSAWMADIDDNAAVPATDIKKVQDAVKIQNELAENWNYYYNFTENASRFFGAGQLTDITTMVNAAFIHDINTSLKQYPLAGLLFRKQCDITNVNVPPNKNYTSCTNFGVADEGTLIACQFLENPASPTNNAPPCYPGIQNQLYPYDPTSGLRIVPSDKAQKSWSPIHTTVYYDDALAMIFNLDRFLNPQPWYTGPGTWQYLSATAKTRIALLVENNEIAPKFSGSPPVPPFVKPHDLMLDPDIALAVTTSGLANVDEFQSYAKQTIDNDYRNQILSSSLNLPSTTKFLNYAVDGRDYARFMYKYRRENQSLIYNGIVDQYYPTTDIYTTGPQLWHIDHSSDKHGWRWLAQSRYREITDDGLGNQNLNDKRFAPFVSPGYTQLPESDMRPGQYLGLLKAIMLQGVDFFHAYSEHSDGSPPYTASTFCWKVAPPVYAQAIGSRLEHFLQFGVSLRGDMPVNTDDPGSTNPSFWFLSQDLQNLITVRQDYNATTPLNRFAIVAAKMKYSNSIGASPLTDVATFNLPLNGTGSSNQTLKIPIRRQGSTYIYDYTNTGNIIFYQLDKWHQYEHPDYWSKDFEFEAEVNDNTQASSTADWTVKSENIITNGNNIDLTNVTSYIHFTAVPSAANALLYTFQPRQDFVANDYALWIRARNNTGGSSNISITLNNSGNTTTVSNSITVNSTNWAWYAVTPNTNTYTGLSDNDIRYYLRLLPSSTNIEIDAIRLASPEYAFCGGVSVDNGNAITLGNQSSAAFSFRGTFTVNHDITFTSCNVHFTPGAQIIVMPGNTLTITGNSTFDGCNRMWRGITVLGGSAVIINNSTISDAEFAVNAFIRSTVICSTATFNNNYCGIHGLFVSPSPPDADYFNSIFGSITDTHFSSTSGQLKPPYPGQINIPPDTKGYAGIILESTDYNVSGINAATSNTFVNLNIGIKATDFMLRVSNCKFQNILAPPSPKLWEGSAVVSLFKERSSAEVDLVGLGKSNVIPTFNNCDNAVYASGFTQVKDCKMTAIHNTGIVFNRLNSHNSVNIADNHIESDHNGIVINQNDGTQSIEVTGNDIYIGQDAQTAAMDNAGIIFANINSSTSSNANIHNNNVNLYNNYYAGIHVLNAGQAAITQNHVEQFNSSYSGLLNPAIKIDNCAGNSINCNDINDNPAITSVNPDKVAIEINNSPGNTIGCNSTNQTGDGYLFHMDCNNTFFPATTFMII